MKIRLKLTNRPGDKDHRRTLACLALLLAVLASSGCFKKSQNVASVKFDADNPDLKLDLESVAVDDVDGKSSPREGELTSIDIARRNLQETLNDAVSKPEEAAKINDQRLLGRRPVLKVLDRAEKNPALMSDAEIKVLNDAEAVGPQEGRLKRLREGGRWDVVKQNFRSQAIHMVVVLDAAGAGPDAFPNDVQVLIVNGSSNRNNLSVGIGTGEANRLVDPKDTENNGIFKPAKSASEVDVYNKLPVSRPEGLPARSNIDLFCGSHLQTFMGDALFVGGTETYAANGTFQGNRIIWKFDWRAENGKGAFKTVGPAGAPPLSLIDGRWYPTLVPDSDGRIHVFGGIDRTNGIARKLEMFDPVDETLDVYPNGNDQIAVQNINNSFNHLGAQWHMYMRMAARRDGSHVLLNDGTGYGDLANRNTMRINFHKGAAGYFPVFHFNSPTRPEQSTSKFYSTGVYDPRLPYDGEAPTFDHYLTLGGQQLSDVLERSNDGPDDNQAPTDVMTRYSPGAFDSQTKTQGPGNFSFQFQFLGRTTGTMSNASDAAPNATKTANLDRRMNHVAVYLPTGDFMVLGGGARGYQYPNFEPLLYRDQRDVMPGEDSTTLGMQGVSRRDRVPATQADIAAGNFFSFQNQNYKSLGCEFGKEFNADRPNDGENVGGVGTGANDLNGFCMKRMNHHRFPRLYHTTAALLQDGRVLLGGGNVQRAQWNNRNPAAREELILNSAPGDLGKFTSLVNPSESQFLEVYSPPYMFEPDRPEITELATQQIHYGDPVRFTVSGGALPKLEDSRVTFIKLGSITHSMDVGARFFAVDERSGLKVTASGTSGRQTATVELNFPDSTWSNILPPGFYYLSFVDEARMVPSKKSFLIQVLPSRVAKK